MIYRNILNRIIESGSLLILPRRIRTLHLLSFLILHFSFLILNFSSCQRIFEPLKQTDISLTADFTGVTDVWLLIETSDTEKEKTFLLERDGMEISRGLIKDEKLYIDENLQPNTRYSYQAFILNEKIKESASNKITITTLDTTSHEFTWELDTIGVFSSTLWDVAAIDENNVWAVGDITINHAQNILANLVIWNGTNYEFKKIMFKSFDGQYFYMSIGSLLTFDTNDIWLFSPVSFAHWNGTEYESEYIFERIGGINAAWGISSNDFYLVGDNGSITHYDGSNFTLMESGTTVDLIQISGVVDPHTGQKRIWVRGGNTVLMYEGQKWQSIWTVENPLFNDGYTYPGSFAILNHKYILMTALRPLENYRCFIVMQKDLSRFKILFESELSIKIIGLTELNDVTLLGSYGSVGHFNGITLKDYPGLNVNGINSNLSSTKDRIFIVGDLYQEHAFILRGKR